MSGDVSLHFENVLTSSWQRLVQRLDENVRHWIPGNSWAHWKSRSVLMRQNALSHGIFQHIPHIFRRVQIWAQGWSEKTWNVIPLLPVFSDCRSRHCHLESTIVFCQNNWVCILDRLFSYCSYFLPQTPYIPRLSVWVYFLDQHGGYLNIDLFIFQTVFVTPL